MKICIPSKSAEGISARVSAHFGSAPFFTLYDTDTREIQVVKNQNQHHEHGQCRPRQAVIGLGVEAVIAAGLGQRALLGLNESGIRVYKTEAKTVGEILDHLEDHLREPMTLESACVHGHSHNGESHDHHHEQER